jgi:SAM-dependent methyltransferase
VSLPAGYFDDFYARGGEDPWGFTHRWYERRKQALTLAALPRERYRSALEPGCSVGVLSSLLARRCDTVLATDVAASALEQAAARVPGNVELRRWSLDDPWPEQTFDLVVLSEVAYYLDGPALRTALDHAVRALEPGGTLLAVHWRHRVEDYPLSGDAVHEAVRATPGLGRLGGWCDEDVVLDVMVAEQPPVRSVAAREGLA